MPESATKAKRPAPPLWPRLRHLVLELIKRTYAIAIIILTAWLSYCALSYLIVTLMVPQPAPEQIVGIPKRLTEQVLQTRQDEWPGVQVSENPRIPLAHYHRIEGWIQPDQYNNCTRAGCHSPLPHSRLKEVRAFLNMHATSIHCGVCHLATTRRPLATTWYDLKTGQPGQTPAVLRLFGWITSPAGQDALAHPTSAVQDQLVERFKQAADEAGGDRALRRLAEHFANVYAGSPAFQQLVEQARTTLPRHFRGQYGSKLARLDDTGQLILSFPNNADAVRKYLALPEDARAREGGQLLPLIHAGQRTTPLNCTDCHREHDRLLDFATAGYPDVRVRMLFAPAVFRMIEHINAGEPFYLPDFISPSQTPADRPKPTAAPVGRADQ